ncbi:mate-domain-containing protein [Rhypophila decipiens]|uniref:Mate-domain-containing protein n=1 Tax=Rhypophila decipiens TaxID=261697 RepID=A0AAN6Y7Y9_9PEZI|nr:mate-domain-containing protein [Rhypophila decipiens]
MSPTQPIRINRRHHDVLETASLLSTSFLASSPIAEEIIARDIEECSDDEHKGRGYDDDDDEDDEELDFDYPLRPALSSASAHHGAGNSTQPSGAIYGTLRPMASQVLGDHDHTLTHREERSLLRDNHILPPKHIRPYQEPLWRQLYRRVFSTKVPETSTDCFGGADFDSPPKVLESSPLLQHDYLAGEGPPSPSPSVTQVIWEAVPPNALKTTWQREAKTLTQYARPLIITFLLHYSVQITSVFTVGAIGTVELGAVSLAAMSANVTGYIPIQGLSTCLDTLCAQAYGSGHKKLVGLQLQRMTYLLWLLLIPIGTLWWFAGRILSSIIPDQETAALASLYLRILILGTPGVAAFESGKRFVQAQGLFHATTYVLLIGAPLNVLANWILVWKMDLGFPGAAAAVVFTQNLLPFLLFLYVRFVDGMECWNGVTLKAFSNWGPMIRLAFPGMVMVLAQYFAFEVLTLTAGQFGKAHLAAQSILVTCTSTTFNIPFPLSIAASTRIANLIGAKMTDAARTSAKVGLVASMVVGLFNLTLLFSLRTKLPYLFTKDQEVAEIVQSVLPICAMLQMFDAIAAMSHGLLRGIGRQFVGTFTNLFSYYLVALPISFSLGWVLGWKLHGLWLGVAIGLCVVSTVELWYLHVADWQKAVEEAEMRMHADEAIHGDHK